jgi:hypothetical protein
MKYHVSIPKGKKPAFNFTAYQYGDEDLPAAVPVALLERKVGPAFRDTVRESEVETVPADGGKPSRQITRTKVRERLPRTSIGRTVIRNVLEVEASSPAEAEAIYRQAVGINSDGTSRKIHVVLASEAAAATSSPNGSPRKPLSADEHAAALLGGDPSDED